MYSIYILIKKILNLWCGMCPQKIAYRTDFILTSTYANFGPIGKTTMYDYKSMIHSRIQYNPTNYPKLRIR